VLHALAVCARLHLVRLGRTEADSAVQELLASDIGSADADVIAEVAVVRLIAAILDADWNGLKASPGRRASWKAPQAGTAQTARMRSATAAAHIVFTGDLCGGARRSRRVAFPRSCEPLLGQPVEPVHGSSSHR